MPNRAFAVASVVSLAAFVAWVASAAACGCAAGPATGPASRLAYAGHRVLVWAVDARTHELRGFAEGTVRPGGEPLKLEPAKGYVITFAAGPAAPVEVTDFKREWKEMAIPFKVSHGTGSSAGSQDLVSPALHVEYGVGEPMASVAFIAPAGSTEPAGLRDLLAGKFKGDLAELDDLILAGTDPKSDNGLATDRLVEAYGVLGHIVRPERWRERLKDKDESAGEQAAAVLARVGDADGQAEFARRVLAAKGNEQVELIEVLAQMPPSDVLLKAIVELITAPGPYRTAAPAGVGVGDMDRRHNLLGALAAYPKEQLQPYAGRLRQWAEKDGEGRQRQVERVLSGERKAD